MNSGSSWRYTLLGILMSLIPLMIVSQIVRIQLNPTLKDAFKERDKQFSMEQRTIYPARGQIYDRWGHVLASNIKVFEVGVDLNIARDPETIARVMNQVLDIKYEDALYAATRHEGDTRVYAQMKDYVSLEKYQELHDMKQQFSDTYGDVPGTPSLLGLVFKSHLMRTYPEKTLGSNILGFVNNLGDAFYGVESQYQDLLAGTPKTVMIPLDPNRVEELPVVPDGASLVLTIDREIQRMLEDVLDDAIAETGSASGTVVIMDPRTGEIMAMATTPRLDLNKFWEYKDVFPDSVPFNRAVSQTYEPGSTYKVLTMAAAFDSGVVTKETTFVDTGVFEYGGVYIYNWNRGAWGPQNMQGCMQHSLNVCLAWVATQLGTDQFYQYMQAFGIGRASGVDMAGDVAGRLKIPGDGEWYDADLAINSFGQGVSVTPVQIAAATSAVANDGKMMAPHVVRSIINRGYQHDIELRVKAMPIKAETAHLMTQMLARSLETESSDALVTGYRVSGKTGTADIAMEGGYTSNLTNASFVGWGPTDDPRFLVYIWLEKPTTSPWGSVVASPLFSEIVERLVVYLNLPPDEVRQQLTQESIGQ